MDSQIELIAGWILVGGMGAGIMGLPASRRSAWTLCCLGGPVSLLIGMGIVLSRNPIDKEIRL
jgi:hypothetical protein